MDGAFTGPTANPWGEGRWTSGSSSGRGATVAAGAVPFAIGSDTSGSILYPAAFTGIAGLRATYGRVSRHGAMTSFAGRSIGSAPCAALPRIAASCSKPSPATTLPIALVRGMQLGHDHSTLSRSTACSVKQAKPAAQTSRQDRQDRWRYADPKAAGLRARRARVCAMVRAPTPEEEDRCRVARERKSLTKECTRHTNRIKGLLFGQGINGYEPLRRDRRERDWTSSRLATGRRLVPS
jgi:hypothetical protein